MTATPQLNNSGTSTPVPDVTEDSLEPDVDLSDLTITDAADPSLAPTPPSTSGLSKAEEDRELERFRNEWRQDLQARRGEASRDVRKRWEEIEQNVPRESGSVRGVSKSPIRGKGKAVSPKIQMRDMPEDLDEDVGVGPTPAAGLSSSPTKAIARKAESDQAEMTDRRDQAVSLYSRAVEHEQSGKLNEALMLYRRAFKLDDNVDRLYARSTAKAAQIISTEKSDTPSSTDIVSSAAPAEEVYSFQRHIQLQPDYEKTAPLLHVQNPNTSATTSGSSRQSPLSLLLSRLPIPPDQTVFLPAEESLPTPISKLPIELLDPILAYMDVSTIERFAQTCWRARYMTSRAAVWRRIVNGIYKAPAVLPPGGTAKDLDVMGRYGGEWRSALVEEERVRMDGCYISVCHYIRPGAGDQWVTVTHMITYHRFLRFYPDGSVISFLTTDHPSEVVPLLRPSLRGKGLHFGRWRLIRSDSPENAPPPVDPPPGTADKTSAEQRVASKGKDSGKRRARIIITDLLEPGSETPKYEFEMELALRETGRGRWNKLDILNYQSINLANGESLALSLKHQKPFYFSKVKSYHPQL